MPSVQVRIHRQDLQGMCFVPQCSCPDDRFLGGCGLSNDPSWECLKVIHPHCIWRGHVQHNNGLVCPLLCCTWPLQMHWGWITFGHSQLGSFEKPTATNKSISRARTPWHKTHPLKVLLADHVHMDMICKQHLQGVCLAPWCSCSADWFVGGCGLLQWPIPEKFLVCPFTVTWRMSFNICWHFCWSRPFEMVSNAWWPSLSAFFLDTKFTA